MRYFVLLVLLVSVVIVGGCERAQQIVNPVMPQEDVLPMIERSHVYESDQLTVSLPGEVGMVKLVEHLADELGNPEVVLLTVQNNATIHRDPSWFSEGQKIKWFGLKAPGVKWGFRPFYWIAPGYTLSEYVEEFRNVPAPVVEGYEFEVTGSISIFFESSDEARNMLGLEHKTRVGANAYVQWAVWSIRSTEEKEIWNVSFKNTTPGSSVVTISAILMTELGDYEVPSKNMITIPYDVSVPFNFIE